MDGFAVLAESINQVMRQPSYSGKFKRDVKATKKRGKNMAKIKTLIGLLIEGREPQRPILIIRSRDDGAAFGQQTV